MSEQPITFDYPTTFDLMSIALAPHRPADASRKLVYGVPRNGMLLTAFFNQCGMLDAMEPTFDADSADIILDDLIDSGATMARYAESHPGVPFVALIDKRDPQSPCHGRWVQWPFENETGPEDAVVRLIEHIGEDPNRDGLLDTPRRVCKAWLEMTAGYKTSPHAILQTQFDEECDEMVMLTGIKFVSLCEHHVLTFAGTADVAYIPSNGKVVGLSKLARLVECFAKRLQIQERMTQQIATAINEVLEPAGVAVVVRGSHSCMACRGVRQPDAEMVTSSMLGAFRDNPAARAEFLRLAAR